MSPENAAALSWEDLPALFPEFTGAKRWLPLLRRHLQMVEEARPHTRVSSVPGGQAVRRQYAESLEILRIALEAGATVEMVADVGSGGGYPGLVFACVLPGSRVDLVEPLKKRARLLSAIAADLGLANVRVHPLRAEEAGRGVLRDSASLVTARAVSALGELLEYTAPLAAPGAMLALPKGTALEDELDAAGPAFEALSCEPKGSVAMRTEVAQSIRVQLVRKLGSTDAKYPRRPGMPAKRPLEKR